MRIVFIIQGEGRGHFTQALVMQELLRQKGDELTAVLVGKSINRQIPDFFTTKMNASIYSFESPNFLPTAQNKRPPLLKSTIYNLRKLSSFWKSMHFIRNKIDELQPDLVINFYELLTGLTYWLIPPKSPFICIGHQYLFLHKDFEFPKKSKTELAFLRFFTHLTAIGSSCKLALSFYDFPDDPNKNITVVPPLLRQEVLRRKRKQGNYIHGYLLNSGYVTEIVEWHRQHPELPLHFFWDKKDAAETWEITPGLTFHQINDTLFLDYMTNCKAFATTSGFESVCEALYLQKPILMVPVHIEQECNAHDAMRVGAGIRADRFDPEILLNYLSAYRPNPVFKKWVISAPSSIYTAITKATEARKTKLPIRKRLLSGYIFSFK